MYIAYHIRFILFKQLMISSMQKYFIFLQKYFRKTKEDHSQNSASGHN